MPGCVLFINHTIGLYFIIHHQELVYVCDRTLILSKTIEKFPLYVKAKESYLGRKRKKWVYV